MTRPRIATVLVTAVAIVTMSGCDTADTPSPGSPAGSAAADGPRSGAATSGPPATTGKGPPPPTTITTTTTTKGSGSNRVALTGTVVAQPGCPGPQRAGVKCPPRPVAGAPVWLTTGTGSTVAQTKTDGAGRFRLLVELGTYVLRARNVGFRSAAREVVAVRGPMDVVLVVDSGLR